MADAVEHIRDGGHRGQGPADRFDARCLRAELAGSAFRRRLRDGNARDTRFGDVIFLSEPVAFEGQKRDVKAQMRWNARGSNSFSAHEDFSFTAT
jgi:hypothetical protein